MARSQQKILGALLLKKSGRSRLWLAWLSLCAGTTLLLLAVMIWWNFRELLYGKHDNDSLGSSFITVSKKVTDANMGRPDLTVFSDAEIRNLSAAPGVREVGQLTSNHFPAYITLNSQLAFSSELFLESVPDRFIDKKPEFWYWNEGDREVPIILSGEFLNLYNYGFALSQGLPQLSETSIQSLRFDLVLGAPDRRETYSARVAGFSDRISSVLVPQSFMEFANRKYGRGNPGFPSRLIVNITDPSDRAFVQYLEDRNYATNGEQLRWSKLRAVVEVISGATGLLAVMLMGISVLVFVLFIELTIARAQQSLVLLLELGYNPAYLKRFMLRRFLPLMLAAMILASALALAAQWAASLMIVRMKLQLPAVPGWPVWAAAGISMLLLAAQIRRAVHKAMRSI